MSLSTIKHYHYNNNKNERKKRILWWIMLSIIIIYKNDLGKKESQNHVRHSYDNSCIYNIQNNRSNINLRYEYALLLFFLLLLADAEYSIDCHSNRFKIECEKQIFIWFVIQCEREWNQHRNGFAASFALAMHSIFIII